LGTLLAGMVIVETIFGLPGDGSADPRLSYIVQTNVMLVAGTFVMLNVPVDLTYAWLAPRIHYQ